MSNYLIWNATKPLDPASIKYPYIIPEPEVVDSIDEFSTIPEIAAKFREWDRLGYNRELDIVEIPDDALETINAQTA